MNLIRRSLLLAIFALTATSVFAQSPVPKKPPKITLSQMETMFQNMRTRTKLNVNGDLLWGYVFMDPQLRKLKPLADELAKTGYRNVEFDRAWNGKIHVLRVEKVETHTPQSLQRRNEELYLLAEKHGVASYDGMDVGPAVPPGKR